MTPLVASAMASALLTALAVLPAEAFDLQGRRLHAMEGKWFIRNGNIEINWNNGAFEKATAKWIDDNTMDYRIIAHSEQRQVGLVTTFLRQ